MDNLILIVFICIGKFIRIQKVKESRYLGLIWFSVYSSPFIMLCLGSIELDHVIHESCYKGTIIFKIIL